MHTQCPTCSKINPANAAYCYYDGRALIQAGLNGPLKLGTRPFSLAFSFPDGQGCANFNQLVLGCDQRWNEARSFLLNGTWESFFASIGRHDLATLAVQSAKELDPDIGLCQLLEGLPADAEALRPAQLSLPATTEDLGALEAGKDHKFQLVIENQGILLLRGSVTTDCDWLFFSDSQGNATQKLFQTRDSYHLSVRVVGTKLRAGPKPLDGQIIIDTNGGREIVAVHATVPVRPFPRGQIVGNVLAGAKSPRELAVKAKAHPNEAAVQFEQGVVKAWYESNGWTYPIQGSQARGKGALQQFFEALGLVKPPRLQIDTERINCRGEGGERLTKQVILSTEEARIVYADAESNQRWIKVLPAKSQGKSVTIPLRIEIPSRPGETLRASVTIQGNGQQRFVVPVTLTVAGLSVEQEVKKEHRSRRLEWIAGGVVLFLFLVGATVVARSLYHHNDPAPPPPVVEGPTGRELPPEVVRWWDKLKIDKNNLNEHSANLKQVAGANGSIFVLLESASPGDSHKGYEELAAKLPELLARGPEVREPLGKFLTECCVYEPRDDNLGLLFSGLADLIPEAEGAYPDKDKGEQAERAAFCQRVVCAAILHNDMTPESRESLASKVNLRLAASVKEDAEAEELKNQVAKCIAEQCYHKMLLTAKNSIEQALAIRDVLMKQFPQLALAQDYRNQEDVQLLEIGLPRGGELWPKLEPIFKACAESDQPDIGRRLIDLYEKTADDGLALKMEPLLAVKWKAAANPKFSRAAKAAAIRKKMAVRAAEAKISPAERVALFRKLLEKVPLSPAKPGEQSQSTPLQDSVRLAHASALASILFNKDAEPGQFDQLLANAPALEPRKPEDKPNKPAEKPMKPDTENVLTVGTGIATVQGQLKKERDIRRAGYNRFVLHVTLKVGETYEFTASSKEFTPHVRVERFGVLGPYKEGIDVKLTFAPAQSGDYDVIVSSTEKGALGSFSLQTSQVQRPHIGFGGSAPETTTSEAKRKAASLDPGDLVGLINPDSKVRLGAFANLADKLPKDLGYPDAFPIARCLLLTVWKESELDQATERLKNLRNCRTLLQAVADVISLNDKGLIQQRTQAIVGALVGKRLDDEDWQSDCRKELLQRALELTPRSTNGSADEAAGFLRDLYKEQGQAFGLDDEDFNGQTRLTPVLERLIKHVADRSVQQEVSATNKDVLNRIGREIEAARFLADNNDIQYAVLLQRIWIKVLSLTLQRDAPPPVRKMMTDLVNDLEKKDRESETLLAQLRAGEEKILRLWALAKISN